MNSRKWAVTLAALGMICMIPTAGMADNLFELPGIGSMKLPAGVTVAEGAQATLNAVNEGRSTSDYWNHKGLRNGNFYSLTYEAPPDYSYGWALSGEVGYPFMLEAGIFTDSNLSQVEQMDSIASWMNTYFKNQKAVFSGSTPLKQVKAGKSHRWEGQVTLTENEKGITYKETWNVVLQINNAKIWLGIVCSDGSRPELGKALQGMISRRKQPKEIRLVPRVSRSVQAETDS
ncbi:MAG: hypothetical protein MRZ11_03910 [Allisonella histaminiformans]|uniref:hypothetical protein n=1 Tax=Allisonella histaminiformans TaxID=209880 RepID=UPI002355FEF7|nr:hypothetical protein [Allisonella histaminiformans]MCI6003424.1 hypothetical protein [Allisonella histaminiformans]